MAIPTTHIETDIHITYIDKEGPFIKLFAQTDKNSPLVERLLYQLHSFLETNADMKPKTVSDLKVGLICCAKFEDGSYYRAKILNMDNIRDHKVKVLFIDYGNCAEVEVKDIRLNSKIIKLFESTTTSNSVAQVLQMENLSCEFYLGGIATRSEWDNNILDILKEKLNNSNMKCSVCEVGGKKIITSIIEGNINPIDILKQCNKCFEIPMTTFIKKLVEVKHLHVLNQYNVPPPTVVGLTRQPPPTRIPNFTQPPPVGLMPQVGNSFQTTNQTLPNRLPGNMPLGRPGIPGIAIRRPEIPPVPLPSQPLQFSTEMLAVGVTHSVYVSHVEDGPHLFAVQIQSEVHDILVKMMTDINNHEPVPIKSPLNPGSICLSRYADDNSLCRAIVTNVTGDKVKLYFADFGNSEVVPYSEIYEIPPQFVIPKVISHRFTLANLKNQTYSDQQKLLFKNLVANSNALQIKVTPPEENPLKQYCDLFLNCKNIKVILAEMMQSMPPLRYDPPQLLTKGSKVKVVVPFVLNPGRFFVHLEKNSSELHEVMAKVATHCRTASHIPLSDLRSGDPCCALYEDETWYRAEILKVYPEKVFINFVDYGNQEEVEHVNLREISVDLVTKTRAQALVCCLKGYELRYNVSEEISNRLEELILEKSLIMHVLGATDTNVLIVELSDNGQDIGTLLDATPVHTTPQPPKAAPAPPVHDPAAHTHTDAGWEGSQKAAASSNSWEEPKYSDSRGPRFSKVGKGDRRDCQQGSNKRYRDEGGKSWRSQQQDGNTTSRFNRGEHRSDGPPFEKKYNKDGEDKPWNRGEGKFNRDENQGGRFNRDEEGGGRFNRDGERKSRFNDDDKGGRFGNSESRGRFNSTDEDKPRRKRDDDDSGGRRNNRDDGGGWKSRENSEGGGWKSRENNEGGGWKSRENNEGGGWKSRENNEGGGWKKDREGGSGGGWKGKDGGSGGGWRDGGGDRKSRFESDGGYKKGGFNEDSGGRSSYSKPWEKGDSLGTSAPKSPKPDSLGGIPYPTAKVGMTETTQVVFTTSPADFYVQLNSSADQLTELMEKIAKACESGEATDMSSVQEKMACLAKYSEDEAWYRAYIEETSFDSTKVLFVDYGNQENVALSNIKVLPEDMSTLPAQAVKCRLYGVPDTAEMCAFSDLTAEKNLVTQFVAKHFPTKSFQVVLVDEESGTNINTAMGAEEEEILEALSKMNVKTPTIPRYTPGTTLTVQLTWYSSPSNFYVQPMASHPEFRAMMQAMQNVVRTGSVLENNQLNIGDFVIARFKADKVLYRALVKETGFLPTVQYLDYGNTETIDSGSVWVMEPEYTTLPIQAFKCSLAGVLPIGDAWPQAETTALDLHFEADTLECTVVKTLEDDTQYSIKLLKNGEDVAAKIIEAGLATSDGGAASELDTSLLVGQLLPVILLRVEDDCSFFAQPLAEDVELQSLETVAGEGFKCWVSVKEDATEEQLAQWKSVSANTVVNVLVDAVQTDGLQVTVYDQEGQLMPMLNNEVLAVEKICPLPVFNMHQKVTVVHAGEEGIFLHRVMWADQLSELLQKLFEFYNELEQIDHKWTEGELCAAKSVIDEQWYRAKILETENDVKVQYIDYGNSESVPSSNLRTLDPAFYTPHAFTVKVTLHVSWNVPLENLLELAGETKYNAVILKSYDGWIVELVDTTGFSLTEKLVELGFATALENSPFKRVVEGGRFVEGSDISVAPTYIDSPLQLWVTVGDDLDLVEALQDRLQEAASKLNVMKEPVGIFAAKYSDGLWYRAVKLDETTVRYIDYGHSYTVDMSDIKELSADFLEPAEGYAVKVELPIAGFREGATERLKQVLIEPTELEGEVTAHIFSVKESYIVADVFKGNQSVIDILQTENLCERLQTASSGFVSYINSLSDFFIQEVGCEEALESIASTMLTAESFEPINEIEIDILVAALYEEDGLWYRAKVTEKSKDSIKVLFIDYGNSAIATEFKSLPTDLASKSPLSKHCSLKLPNCVDKWSEAAFEKFLEISADGSTQFDVKFLNNDNPATVQLTFDGKNISEELKSLCDVREEPADTQNTPHDLTDYNVTVYISHMNSVSDFYVQQDGAEVELDAIKEELSDVSSYEAVDQVTEDVKEQIVGALFIEDETWYRAKILETVEDEIKVLFIDYGNTAVATKFVKLPETLSNKLPVATHCSLGRENLSEKANIHLATLADEGTTPFFMKVIKEGDPQIVSLIADNVIIEKELDRLFALQTEGISDNILDKSIVKRVFLIQVNSPDDFFLHTAEATQQIEDINEQLLKADGFPPVEASQVTEGEILAAQIDEDDLWHRAKVIENSENETKVLFIDLGNTVKVAKMKFLPEDLLLIPPLAMHCSLQKPGNNQWSPKAIETFNKLANDEAINFDLKILSSQEETPLVVELYINGESVVKQLVLVNGLISETQIDQTEDPNETEVLLNEESTNVSHNKEAVQESICEIRETEVLLNEEITNVSLNKEVMTTCLTEVQISHFNNTNDFFVQSLDDRDELSNITKDMSQAESFEAVIDTDDIVAAKCNSDQLWYRAKVLDRNSDSSTVILIDSGHTDTANQLKKLPNNLAEKKPLAKHCCLKSPKGVWSEATIEKLSALAKIKDLTFQMKIINDGIPCEIDLFVNDRSLIDTFMSDEISDDLNNEIQNLILDSVEREVSSSQQNEVKDISEQLITNIEDTVRNISDEMPDNLNTEIQDMILDSVEKEISSSLRNDMRDITEQLISNVDTVNQNKEKEIQQITDDLKSNVQEKIIENESKPMQETLRVITKSSVVDDNNIDVTNTQIDNDSKPAKEDVHVPEDSVDTSPKKEIEPSTDYCSSNGHTNEGEDSEIVVKPSMKTQSEREIVSNHSPITNRRLNFDEQIVPGCISTVKTEDSTDKP